MKKIIQLIYMIIFLMSCNQKPEKQNAEPVKSYSNIINYKDTLFAVNEGVVEYGSPCGFVNQKGDTVIPIGRFEMCFTDTFTTFAYVFDKKLYGDKMVAINRKGEVIFDAYLFDNGPDYSSQGLIRILRNGKIGFANEKGEVRIEPKYKCAYPFENGKAKVAYDCETITDDLEHSTWKSSNWIYIDKNGNETIKTK